MPHEIEQVAKMCWRTAEDKGFHKNFNNGRTSTLVRLCLIHSEVSEAAQIVKKQFPIQEPPVPEHNVTITEPTLKALAAELADIVIRVFDLAECSGINIEQAIANKRQINDTRPYLYGTAAEKASHSDFV